MKALKPTFGDKPVAPSGSGDSKPLFTGPVQNHEDSATMFAGDAPPAGGGDWQANLVFGKTIGVDTAPDMGQRYEIQGEIAHGGMGVVFRGIDREVGRPIAVKVLREKHQGKPDMLHRFIEEAQVTGQLQHPGIVPVYEIGYLPGRLPYFSMRLVEGKTLETLIKECQSDPALAAASRHRFLKIFGQVAQTLAYAHARGVIHRDLKPHNIMVGNFGEILVMDWGLAKVLKVTLGARMPTVESTFAGSISTIRNHGPGEEEKDDPSDQTKAGSIIGTPAYMAPEQARGELAKTDYRSDVFGLGAILCQILTGKPPFPGATGVESCTKASRADLKETYERIENCGADPGWIVLAHECLSEDPDFRPPDAGHVAARVSAYFADLDARVQRAEKERAKAEVEGREADKRRRQSRRWFGVVAALAVALAGGAVVWMHFSGSHELELAALREKQATDERNMDRQQADRRRAVAVAAAQIEGYRDQSRFAQARATLEQAELLAGNPAPPELAELLGRARRELNWAERIDKISVGRGLRTGTASSDAGADYAAAFREAGFGADERPAEEVARLIRGSGVRFLARDVLDEWFGVTEDPARRAWLRQVRTIVGGGEGGWSTLWDLLERRENAAMVRTAARSDVTSTRLLMACAEFLDQSGVPDDAWTVALMAHAKAPGDFWTNYGVGALLAERRPAEAVGFCRAAVALRPDSAAAQHNLGFALGKAGHAAEAKAVLAKAAALDYRRGQIHRTLAILRRDPAEQKAAEEAFRRALAAAPEMAVARSALADLMTSQGRQGEARAEYEKMLEGDPARLESHVRTILSLLEQGHFREGLGAIRRARERFPESHFLLLLEGNACGGLGRDAEAIAAYRRSLAISANQPDAHINLGFVLARTGAYAEAVAATEKGLALGKAGDPAWTYGEEWLEECRRLNVLAGRLAGIQEGKDQAKTPLENARLGSILRARGDAEGAVRFYVRAFAGGIQPDEEGGAGGMHTYRYNAACQALLLASSGGGKTLSPEVCRRYALRWLGQCLESSARSLRSGDPRREDAVREITHWMVDEDLASVRDRELMDKLPAAERAEWDAFWAACERMVK